jgi:Domain of unknown function (DUF4386)
MPQPRTLARIAGLLYLLVALLGGFGIAVRSAVVVRGDAAATTENIRASATLFRLGFARQHSGADGCIHPRRHRLRRECLGHQRRRRLLRGGEPAVHLPAPQGTIDPAPQGTIDPVALSVLGVIASLILIVGVPLQAAGGQATAESTPAVIWIPMIIFEISTGLWLLVRGANAPKVE